MPSFSSHNWKPASSPYINRFVQPDTIIPDLSNPQSWNRFSYVTNRPVNFSDPTGHKETDDLMGGGTPCERGNLACQIEREEATDDYNGNYDPRYDTDDDGLMDIPNPHYIRPIDNHHKACEPEDTLVECFYKNGLLVIDGEYHVGQDELNALALAVFFDIEAHKHVNGYIMPWERGWYDTPFYNAGGKLPGNVCIDGERCYTRTEVNYLAQGMIAAANGESKTAAMVYVSVWKRVTSGNLFNPNYEPSPATYGWDQYGHDFYTTGSPYYETALHGGSTP